MEGVIASFRGSRRVKHHYQMIIEVPSVKGKEDASKLVGKKVTWKSPAGKAINGQITAAHGGNGAMRARFESGMPGQSLGAKVSIQ